ncbi:nesprin-2 [Trichomycterus rosablanca]|uniref:nesprin-2 n=1 Tax=Trichomycterus rosablanca TaxID=2290929 RepID=UPI002F35A9B5
MNRMETNECRMDLHMVQDLTDFAEIYDVEQLQIQKRTFTNWVNAQLSKRKPPVTVLNLFNDFRDGSKLLDLLEVMCNQRMNREKGKGTFQHRANIEKALAFLRGKSIKLVNINVPDIMDGKPSIILGLIWTIIMHFHIEELASTLSFSSRQSSLESLTSLDTRSTSSSARSSPVPPRGSPLHTRFRISAKKALLLWVREQCHKAGCTLNVKDFKASWRSGVVFLAILCALRPDVVNLPKAKIRSNRQNLEEAFHIAERELNIPRLLDPADVDVRDPDEKSIMTYVAQFLQYSKDVPVSEEDMQVQYLTPPKSTSPVNLPSNFTPAIAASPLRQTSASQKVHEVTCWLEQAYQELLEGWVSTEGESYAERYHVFQTFVVSFNEQRRPVMPLLTAMKRTPRLSDEQQALRHIWESLAEKLREYKIELDLSLPSPLDTVGRWLLRAEELLSDSDDAQQDHAQAAQEACEKQELLKSCLEETPQHMKTFQIFQNMDEFGEMMVPTDKLDEIKRRFTSVRVSGKYHGIRLEYQEHRHTVMDLLTQLTLKLCTWKRAYFSQEAVRVLMQDWNEIVNKQNLPSLLEAALCKLKHTANKYTSKSALAGESSHVSLEVKNLEAEAAATLEDMNMVKGTMGRVQTAWDSYRDSYSSLHAWLEQGSQTNRHGHRAEVTVAEMNEWSSRRAHLNDVGNYLIEITDQHTSHSLSDDLCRINLMWADFARRTQFDLVEEQNVTPASPQTLQGLIKEASQLLKEPVEVLSGSLQTYRKRLQFMMKKIQNVDLDSLSPSLECSAETLNKFKQAFPEVLQTLCEAMEVCKELQQTVSSLDGRLAELLLWEAEARELHDLIKEKAHRHQRGQNSRTRLLISRGLQLEGQVVTEEQDLQEMVMSGQKNSPLQYLIASTMQDRVRAAVAQSQEAVGMLSSLGARRDRSPVGHPPPQKVFVQEQKVETQSQKLQTITPAQPFSAPEDSQSSVILKSQELSRQSESVDLPKAQTQPQSVPMIVVQDFQEETKSTPAQFSLQRQEVAKTKRKEELIEDEHDCKPEASTQARTTTAVTSQASTDALEKQRKQKQEMTKDTNQKQQQVQINQQHAPTSQQPHISMQQQTQVQQTTTIIKQQTQSQQQQVQTVSQHSIKVRKSQARLENRPWLQKKAQVEVSAPAQLGKLTSEVQLKSTVVSTPKPQVSTPEPIQAQTRWVTQTQVKVTQIQPQQTMTQANVSQIQQQKTVTQTKVQKEQHVTQPKTSQVHQQDQVAQVSVGPSQQQVTHANSGQVQQQNQVTHTKIGHIAQWDPVTPDRVGQAQQQQRVTQARLGQTQQQQPVSQMFQQQSQITPSGTSLIQAQTVKGGSAQISAQRHPQPYTAPSIIQPQMMTPKQPERQMIKQAQSKTFIPVQPQVMTRMQPPTMTHTQPIMSQIHQYPPTVGKETQTMAQPIRHSIPSTQPQTVTPKHPQQIHLQAFTLTTAHPKGSAPIQPRIISMPQSQPQNYIPPHPQMMSMGQTQHTQNIVQPPYIQQTQWRPIVPEAITHSYHDVSRQGSTPAEVSPQVQFQSYPQTPKTQWAPVRGSLVTQTYPSVLGQPQSQVYPPSQAQNPWIPFRSEPMAQPFAQRPQSPNYSTAPSQWRPIRPEVISYQGVYIQGQGQMPQYSQSQHPLHATSAPRYTPQSPPQQLHMQPDPQAQKPFQNVHQPMQYQQPWIQPLSQSPVRPKSPASQQSQTHQQQWPQNPTDTLKFQVQIQSQSLIEQPQVVQVVQKPQLPAQEQDKRLLATQIKVSAPASAPPQANTDAFTEAQELSRKGFEKAKHCLQEHILQIINIFKDQKITDVQLKEETQKTLNPELLQEFLRAAAGMEAFCMPPQLQEIKFFTQTVRTQWEVCFSAEGSTVQTGKQMEALMKLYETLSPEDARRLALADIQHQISSDQNTLPDSSVPEEQKQETSQQKILTALPEKPMEVSPEATPVIAQRQTTVAKKEILKQTSTEEERYRSSRFALQAQLNRNEQNMLGEHAATATDLQKRLRELKALQDETESLWSEYDLQCSQFIQINERMVEQDRAELTVKWKEQRAHLQRRVDSLGSALELMDSIEQHIAEISDHLDKFIKEPKDVKGYVLINTDILKNVKDLDESIQTQMDRLSRFDSEPSHLDLRDRSPLTQLVLKHRSSLDRLRHQVCKSEAAARALDRFLVSLCTVDQDVRLVQNSPCDDLTALQESRSKLGLIRKGAASLTDKAPQLDLLLKGAQMEVTQEGSAVTCLNMVEVLVRQIEDVDDKLIIQQEGIQKENQSHGLKLSRNKLLAELRKVLGSAETQGLKEPTMPAVQHRIRALSDLEAQINLLRPEYQSLKEATSKLSLRTVDELETLWEETERAVIERQEQCSTLMDLLKRFQSCRSSLNNILQRAEQTISEQASYMGKDNLQRLITKVCGLKDDLNGLGPNIEEFRGVCRQLQSQLKRLPDCPETPFETEADALVDTWLDVSEKTDAYMDNLRVGLELWEKQLMLGGELEVWAAAKLNLFAQSHPFSTEKEVLQVKEEIQVQEENIEQFVRKSLEIQELLQSKEAPLELQVMETALKKKMDQVRELFSSCTEVLQELLSVRAHLLQRIDTCRSAIQRINSSVSMLSTDNKDQLQHLIQDLSEQLLDQEDEVESLMKEVDLMGSVTAPQALEELSNQSKNLKDGLIATHELICKKKEQGERSYLIQSINDEFQMFEDWLQDEQLAVNECFENPEKREDVEASMLKLKDFLVSGEGEQRLSQVKNAIEKKDQEIPAETQVQLSTWQQEQEGELSTLRAHCHGRHKQLEDILFKLNSLQEERDHLQEWLEQREQIPEKREKLRQVHEDFLKESGRIEAFTHLLASVRLRGLRGDPLLKDSESMVDRYHSLGICLENKAQVFIALEEEVETFHTEVENFRTWLRDLKQSMALLDKSSPIDEQLYKVQTVLDLQSAGDAKLAALKKEAERLCYHEELEEMRQQELVQTLRNVDDEWRRVLDLAQQLKAQAEFQQSLLRELESLKEQEKNTRSWIEEQMQKLNSIQERGNKVQDVLSLECEGELKLTTLRKTGKSICAHKELGSDKRFNIEQNQTELDDEWKRVLQAAKELKNLIDHEESLSKKLKSFQDEAENMQAWIKKLKETLASLDNASPAEILNRAQAALIHGPEGDSKLATLKSTGNSVCASEGLKDHLKESVQQTLSMLEQEWKEVLNHALKLRDQAEFQEALEKEMEDFHFQEGNLQAWIVELEQGVESLDKDTPVEDILLVSQTVLNLQPEAESKIFALKSKGESLGFQLQESQKNSIQQTLNDVQKKWEKLMELAQELHNQAEIQNSLSNELKAFQSEQKMIQSWVVELKQDLESLGKSTHGTQEQIEARLSKAQAVLSLRPEGNSKIASLKRRADNLCGSEDLDAQIRHTLLQNLRSLEEDWKRVVQHAQELHSLLKSVVERLVSCQCQQQQTHSRIEQLKQQTAALPRHFPWPGLGERRHAVEQAKTLLDKTSSLSPTLSALRALGREMSQLTRDPSWTDPSWMAMEECIPGLIKDLTELCENLEVGIHTERTCVQLVEQHSAAQDWLREQVKGFGDVPTDRHGLQGSINTLKALLQTIEREQKEMRELNSLKDSLINFCTPGGCDALTLEISQLHNLCTSSESEIRARLNVCESRLADIEMRLANKAESLRSQAECVLNQLRDQENSLGFKAGNNFSQLQENWQSLKNGGKKLEDLEGKVCDLGQTMRTVPSDENLPSNIISLVDSVTQQYCRLRSKLSERQNDCADSAVHCIREALHTLRTWNQAAHTEPASDSVYSMQTMLEEGANMQKDLQMALSHKQLLMDCLGPVLAEKLDKDGTSALNDADSTINKLTQQLKDHAEKKEKEAQSIQVSTEVPNTSLTTIKPELDWAKTEDIIPAPMNIDKQSTRDNDTCLVVQTLQKEASISEEMTPNTEYLTSEESLKTLVVTSQQESAVTDFVHQISDPTMGEAVFVTDIEGTPVEHLSVPRVDDHETEFKTDDVPKSASAMTSKLQEDVSESAVSVSRPIISESEQIKMEQDQVIKMQPMLSEELHEIDTLLEERPMEIPESESYETKITLTYDEKTSENTTEQQMNTHQTSDLPPRVPPITLESELATQVDESGIFINNQTPEHKVCDWMIVENNKEQTEGEKVQPVLSEELEYYETSVQEKPKESLKSECPLTESDQSYLESATEKILFDKITSDTSEHLDEDSEVQKNKVAEVILDIHKVHIHTNEVLDVSVDTDNETSLLQAESMNRPVSNTEEPEETRKELLSDSQICLDKELLKTASTEADQLQISSESSEKTPELVSQISNNQMTTDITPGNNDLITAIAEQEETWTRDSDPHEAHRILEPLVLEQWNVDNGPREIQLRYIILERREGLEIHEEPNTWEATVPTMDAATNEPEDSKPAVTEEVRQEVDDTLKGKEQSEVLRILPVKPPRQKRESITSEKLGFITEEVEIVDDKIKTSVGESKPTPPTRRRKETDSLLLNLDVQSEMGHVLPVALGEQCEYVDKISPNTEIQVPGAEVLPTPPNRRRKTLGEENLPLVVDSQPTPPTRRRKDKGFSPDLKIHPELPAEHHGVEEKYSPELKETSEKISVEPIVKLTPPVRRKTSRVQSDSISVKSLEMEETLIKLTPPSRRRGSRNIDPMGSRSSSIVDLGKTLIQDKGSEEFLVKPAPPVRRKTSQVEIDETLMKPTPPVRRRASRNLGKLSYSESNLAEYKSVEKPTPPMRRKGSQVDSDIISVDSKPKKVDQALVKPTPPTRRKDNRNVTDSISEEIASSIYASTDLEKKLTQDKAAEEDLGKRTPPERQKAGQTVTDLISVTSKPQEINEMLVTPTSPTRRKDIKKVPDETDVASEDLVKPTPPVRRKASHIESDKILGGSKPQEMEMLVEPTHGGDLIMEESKEIVSEVKAVLEEPTPPVRQKAIPTESETISDVSKIQEIKDTVIPTPPTRTKEKKSISDKVSKEGTSHSSSSTSLEETVTQEKAVEEDYVEPTTPVGQKANEVEGNAVSVVCQEQNTEETLVHPTSDVMKNRTITSDTGFEVSVSQVQESVTEPTPPIKEENETEQEKFSEAVCTELKDALHEPTPQIQQEDDKADLKMVQFELEMPLNQPTLPSSLTDEDRTVTQVEAVEDNLLKDKYDQCDTSSVVPEPQETETLEDGMIKPSLPLAQKVSPAEQDISSVISKPQEIEETMAKPEIPKSEVQDNVMEPAPLVSEKNDQTDREIVPLGQEVPLNQPTTPGNLIDDDRTVTQVEAVEKNIKCDTPSVVSEPQETEALEDDVKPSQQMVLSSVISEPQEIEETLVKPSEIPKSEVQDNVMKPAPLVSEKNDQTDLEIVPLELEVPLNQPTSPSSLIDDDRTVTQLESVDKNLIKRERDECDTPSAVSEPQEIEQTSSANQDISSVISKSQEIEETMIKPSEIPKSEVQDNVMEPAPLVSEKNDQTDLRIVPLELEVPPNQPTSPSSLIDDDRTVTKIESVESSVKRERDECDTPSVVFVLLDIEETSVKPETPKSEVQDNVIEPAPPLREEKDQTDLKIIPVELEKPQTTSSASGLEEIVEEPLAHLTPSLIQKDIELEHVKASAVSPTVEEDLAKPTLPVQQRKDQTDVEIIPAELEELQKTTSQCCLAVLEESTTQEEIVEIPLVQLTPPIPQKDIELQHGEVSETVSASPIPAEDLPKPTLPVLQSKDETDFELELLASSGKSSESIQVQQISELDDEVSIEEKTLISQEQPKKEIWSDVDLKSADVLAQNKSISLVQAQLEDQSKASGLDVSAEGSESQLHLLEDEEPRGPTMNAVFIEIEKMSKKRPSSLLIESRLLEDPLEVLNTSVADLEAQLNRLLFRILSCRSLPAVLNPIDMAKQVEEAECCRQSAQKQISFISKQNHANGDVSLVANGSVHDPEAMQRLSCQWTEALWDATGTLHSKEAQLQLVIDYDRQQQKARGTLEKLKAELESLRMYPVESSFVEEQRLRSFLRTMEQERTVLGELIQIHSQLSTHLSQPERAEAESQLSIIQCKWMQLQKSTEKNVHHVSSYTKESFSLLQDIDTLKDHVEKLLKVFIRTSRFSVVHWDSKRTQDMIELSADLTAAQQSYFDLQQRFGALSKECTFKTEASNIEQGLWCVKDQLDLLSEQLACSVPTSSNPTMAKIVKVVTEALAWAKQTGRDIESRQRKVSLLPEEVHRQIKDLKKLRSEMNSKQAQLETLIEEVTDLIPELGQADVPMVTYFLETLKFLSKTTSEKLNKAMEEIQLSLQTREKISEQMALVDSWILGHLLRESLRREDCQSLSAADLDKRLQQSQDALCDAEKQFAVTEALLMKSKDIASELSISENTWLYEKLSKLQEDIKGIITFEKTCSKEIANILQNQDSSNEKVTSLEQSLRQIVVDVKEHIFPVTKNSLSTVEPIKCMIVEHKHQVEHVTHCSEDKRKELLCLISEIHNRINALDVRAQSHERFLSLRQRVEDLKENIELQVPKTKDKSTDKKECYKICQSLLSQIPLIKVLNQEASQELENISSDLHPSQLTAEQMRLKQNLESLNTWEMAIQNNLQTVEWDVLQGVHYPSEEREVLHFLNEVNGVLEKPCVVEPNHEAVKSELKKILNIKRDVEARMQVLEVLLNKNGVGLEQGPRKSKYLADLAIMVLDNYEKKMENLSKANEMLKNYFRAVASTSQYLQRIESILLPSLCSPRSCSEMLKDILQTLSTLDSEFQSHVTQLQALAPFHPLFLTQKIEDFQLAILSHLLVRVATVKAQAQLRLEAFERCVNRQRNTRTCYEVFCQRIRDLETILAECATKKITSQKDCSDQQEKLKTLVEEVDILPGRLKELSEWCSVQGCRANRDDAVGSLWCQVARLRRCARDLLAHSGQRAQEWISIGKSMEKASIVLNQLEADLQESIVQKATGEELHDLLQFWTQYQDRLDCQQRAMSALELRAARLMRVPPDLEQAPPISLCQQLQTMQERYYRLKDCSTRGHRAVQVEMEERKKTLEELQRVQEWLVAAVTLLTDLEQKPNTVRLQELHSDLCSQKVVLQHIMENLKVKYQGMDSLVPVEIEGPLQEVPALLQAVENQVKEAVQKSGPLYQLNAKLSEINAGLEAVQNRLLKKCPNVQEAENSQKYVWDELDSLHSRLTAVEVELQDLSEEKEEMQAFAEKLAHTQEQHTRLSKQAENRTTLLSKMPGWIQEHGEMVQGSQSWITESLSWLNASCTYTTAKCLDTHANALQMVLNDSEQIRRTLQGFESVLKDMASVCDVRSLQQELSEADQRVVDMQNNLLELLNKLEHASAEIDAMESELKIMEKDVIELKTALTSKQGITQDKFKTAVDRIELMKRTVDEMQNCKTGLGLPEGAENSFTVFSKAELLLKKLLELEQLALEHTVVVADPCEMPSTFRVPPTIIEEETQDDGSEQGQVEIVHMREDVLTQSGAVLMTITESTPEERFGLVAQTEDSERDERGAAAATTTSTSTEAGIKETDPKEAEVECVASETSPSEAASESEATVRAQSPSKEPERGAQEGEHIKPEVLKMHTSETHTLKQTICTLSPIHLEQPKESKTLSADSQGPLTLPEASDNLTKDPLRQKSSKDTLTPCLTPSAPSLEDMATKAAHTEPTQSQATCTPHQRTANVLVTGETQDSGIPDGEFHSCHERAAQMEVWLEKAWLSLDSDMLQSVEQQLQTCQEMFVEIEEKVASVSAPGNDEEQRALSAKLQLLKNNLVTFQLLLQERYTEEKACAERERPLQAKLKRSASVQEILSSSKAKLFRQNSLQQQKELEQGLSEQRDLTKVIAAQGSRARLQSLTTEEQARSGDQHQ